MLHYHGPSGAAHDQDTGGVEADTARLWVSEQQWMAILERVKRGDADGDPRHDFSGGWDALEQREHARMALSFRCVMRLAPPRQPAADHGTYVVHTRNISSGGLGFVHDAPLHPGTRCTVGLQPCHGRGMILPARVAWCRRIDRDAEDSRAFDVGVQFDRPIDISPFLPAA